MTIGSVSSTPSYALTDKDRKMIDDLLVNATINGDEIENYDDLAAALDSSNALINNSSYDSGQLLNVLI